MTYFIVITEIPKSGNGNYSTTAAYIDPNADKVVVGSNIIVDPPVFNEDLFGKAAISKTKIIDLSVEQIVFCSIPVFQLGEILVMDSNDRSIPDGRKPSKWDVSYETFTSIKNAIIRAKEVMENDQKT